jgi:hypothetical protein
LREAITRQADRFEVRPPDIDGFAAGAMRRRRRDRTVAALAACAVLAIVASGLVAERSWWDTRGAGPTNLPTSPTGPTTSSADDRVGIIGPPPPGTPPTGPATGELVAAATTYNSGTWVYSDGRLINVVQNFLLSDAEFRGVVVRYLTSSGVEAMRSFLLDGTTKLNPSDDPETFVKLLVREGGRLMTVRPFAACGNAQAEGAGFGDSDARAICPPFEHPEEWLPASAWEDPVLRPFVPHTYQVGLDADQGLSPAEVLPAEAVDLLLGPESALADSPIGQEGLSRRVATPVASELASVMDQAGPAYARREGHHSLSYDLPSDAHLGFGFVLPHGGTYCDCS